MNSSNREYRIGVVAKQTSVKIETIRYYEKIGLLRPASRERNGYRLYAQGDINRLIFIRKCRGLGFSLEDTTALLNLSDNEDRSCRDVRDIAENRLESVREKLTDLLHLEGILENFVETCPGDTSSDCPIINSLVYGGSPLYLHLG